MRDRSENTWAAFGGTRMTNAEQGFSPEQLKDIYLKIEMSRMLVKMGNDMTKQIEADLKFYAATNNLDGGNSG
tara:strand:- start:446 stop:664 length:219 start_codon:yes stop_codon:yes gene_type:complete